MNSPKAPATSRAVSRSRHRAVAALNARSTGRALSLLERASTQWNAPVLTLMAAQERDPFKILIGCVLSLRTKDETTAAAATRLFALADTPERMLALDSAQLEKAIFPVGFYRTKAAAIKQICRTLLERFGGQVPDSIEQLLELKGVGRKTANLVVTQAFGKPGICVDTHVHRITNRWGLVRTKDPHQTELELRRCLPRRHWIGLNTLLVAFGQTICQPLSPLCSGCPIKERCPRIGVIRSR